MKAAFDDDQDTRPHSYKSASEGSGSLKFYAQVFGVKEYFRDDDSIQVQGPGPHDVIAFERNPRAGKRAGIDHFGFRLTKPADIDRAVKEVEDAVGKILRASGVDSRLTFRYVAR